MRLKVEKNSSRSWSKLVLSNLKLILSSVYAGQLQPNCNVNPFAVHDGYSRRHHFAQSVIINHN